MLFWLIQLGLALALAVFVHAVTDYTKYHRRLTPARLKLEVFTAIAMSCAGICCAISL